MEYLDVAVPSPLARTFTYTNETAVAAGTRVLVPFGKRRVVGVVVGAGAKPESAIDLKRIDKIVDEAPVYGPAILEIARWLAAYYMHPIGEVLRTMLPASTTKVVKQEYVLTPDGEAARADRGTADGELLGQLFGKKKSTLAAVTLKSKLAKLAQPAAEDAGPWAAPPAPPTVKDLVRRGLISVSRGTAVRARAQGNGSDAGEGAAESATPSISAPPELRPAQVAAFRAVVEEGLRPDKPAKPFLLHGVTGSGKTEVYLHLIAEAMRGADGAQALVLVPEISLTPQMTRVFESRFPGRVAVVHSAMTDPDRWTQLERVRRGDAAILIGPRSAVFGPFRKLALILVDEEHDNSYKQSTGLTYNGRDIAVLRGRLEGAAVVLGSATPSMESYNNALSGRYRLLEMKERVTGRPLPDIEVIAATQGGHRKGAVVGMDPARAMSRAGDVVRDEDAEIPIDGRVLTALQENMAAGRQAIVLVNRRGYAYYLYSLDEKKAVQCPHCSISLTLHARSTQLRCHYCDYSTTFQRVSQDRPKETFVAVGYGSQKAEDCLKAKLPGARIVRLDSDTVANRELLPATLGKFREGKIDILVGTQILAKGHDFPNVTLIVILEVDQLLGLPDFRAGERTFQLIVQAAGRAGRADLPGKVLIQSLRSTHPVVTAAVGQDYAQFAERELKFRRQLAYPPFTRMIAIELNSPDKPRLSQLCQRIESWLEQMGQLKPDLLSRVRVLGPSIPPIETIRLRHRRTLIFSADTVEPLRQLVAQFMTVFQKPSGDVRIKIDVDPQSLI
jgi:primosomal protein N' (replication factor Y)